LRVTFGLRGQMLVVDVVVGLQVEETQTNVPVVIGLVTV